MRTMSLTSTNATRVCNSSVCASTIAVSDRVHLNHDVMSVSDPFTTGANAFNDAGSGARCPAGAGSDATQASADRQDAGSGAGGVGSGSGVVELCSGQLLFRAENVDEAGRVVQRGFLEVTEQTLVYHVGVAALEDAGRSHAGSGTSSNDLDIAERDALVERLLGGAQGGGAQTQTPGRNAIRWRYTEIRRYGCERNLFTIEAGRRARTGAGIFAFRTPSVDAAQRLFTSLQTAVRSAATRQPHSKQEAAIAAQITPDQNNNQSSNRKGPSLARFGGKPSFTQPQPQQSLSDAATDERTTEGTLVVAATQKEKAEVHGDATAFQSSDSLNHMRWEPGVLPSPDTPSGTALPFDSKLLAAAGERPVAGAGAVAGATETRPDDAHGYINMRAKESKSTPYYARFLRQIRHRVGKSKVGQEPQSTINANNFYENVSAADAQTLYVNTVPDGAPAPGYAPPAASNSSATASTDAACDSARWNMAPALPPRKEGKGKKKGAHLGGATGGGPLGMCVCANCGHCAGTSHTHALTIEMFPVIQEEYSGGSASIGGNNSTLTSGKASPSPHHTLSAIASASPAAASTSSSSRQQTQQTPFLIAAVTTGRHGAPTHSKPNTSVAPPVAAPSVAASCTLPKSGLNYAELDIRSLMRTKSSTGSSRSSKKSTDEQQSQEGELRPESGGHDKRMYSVSDRETAVSDHTATSSSVFGPASSSVSHSSAAAPPRSRPNTGPASAGGGASAAGMALSALSSSQSNSSISATADAPMSAGPGVVLPGRAGGTVFRYPAARLFTNPTASMSISSCDSQQPLLSQSGSMASACSSRPSSDGMGVAAAGEYTKIDMDRTTALNMSIRELQERQERHCKHLRGVGGMGGGAHGGGAGGSVWPKHPAVAGLTLMSLSCSSSFQAGSSPAPPHAAGPVGMSASLHSACLPSNCKCASAVPVAGALSSSCHAAHAPTGASTSASGAAGAADTAAGATLRAVDHAAKDSARSGSIADLLARRSRHNSTAS